MRRKFKIEIARQVYQSIMNYGTVSPMALHNACELVGIGMHPKRKNYLLMYFMVKEPYDKFDRDVVATELELKQSEYILSHLQDNLKDFIDAMENDIIMDDDRTFDKTQLLDAVFSAADTDGEWSHEEGEVISEASSMETLLGDYQKQLDGLEDNDDNKKERTVLKVKITKLKKKMDEGID